MSRIRFEMFLTRTLKETFLSFKTTTLFQNLFPEKWIKKNQVQTKTFSSSKKNGTKTISSANKVLFPENKIIACIRDV